MSYIELRKSFGDPWVFGTCIEIGAGLRPVYHSRIQELFVSDKRQGEEFEAYFGQPSPNPIIDISNIESVFPSGVDSITGHHVIEHLDNPILVIGDWLRLLKEGGSFIFQFLRQRIPQRLDGWLRPLPMWSKIICFIEVRKVTKASNTSIVFVSLAQHQKVS